MSEYIASRARVIADSIAPCGVRLLTWETEYPRMVHADIMTHRDLSRNARSSRAEPLANAIRRAIEDPVRPLVWMYDEKRMKHGELMTPEDAEASEADWVYAREVVREVCGRFLARKMHRQYATRILEPFLRIKVVYSATNVNNLYALRIHPAPQPEAQQLVVRMARAAQSSVPRKLKAGEWHLPYVTDEERSNHPITMLLKASTSRLARISYDSLDGKEVPIEAECRLHDQLLSEDPKHASPSEHPGMATGDKNIRSGNYRGYVQYRHTITGESAPHEGFDLHARLIQYEGRDYIL